MREIVLKDGSKTKVDDIDYEFAIKNLWVLSNRGYAVRGITLRGKKVKELLHREIIKRMFGSIPRDLFTDHINGNRLDNQRNNLRLANRSQNQANVHVVKNKYGFKGISMSETRKRWKATIKFNQKTLHLGYFSTSKEAALAYDIKAKELFGEFARLNF